MNNIMTYKGYIAQIEYNDEDADFFGTIVNLSRDQICFRGTSARQLKKHMRDAIEDHLEKCKSRNITPEKPYSGRITFRTTPKDHAILVQAALLAGNKSLNEWMSKVLLTEVARVKYQHARRNSKTETKYELQPQLN
jgi:predicted HicB family RNase H-like nuclease